MSNIISSPFIINVSELRSSIHPTGFTSHSLSYFLPPRFKIQQSVNPSFNKWLKEWLWQMEIGVIKQLNWVILTILPLRIITRTEYKIGRNPVRSNFALRDRSSLCRWKERYRYITNWVALKSSFILRTP